MAKNDTALWLIGGAIAAWFLIPKETKDQIMPGGFGGISFPDITFPDISFPDISFPDVTMPDFSLDLSNLFGNLLGGLPGIGGGNGNGGLTFPLIDELGNDWGAGVSKISDIWSQIVSGPRAYYEGWIDFLYRQTIGPGIEAGQAATMSEMHAAAQAGQSPEQFALYQARLSGEITGPEFVEALKQLQATLNENLSGISAVGSEVGVLTEMSMPTLENRAITTPESIAHVPSEPIPPVTGAGQWYQAGNLQYQVFTPHHLATISPEILGQYYAGSIHVPEGYSVSPEGVVTTPEGGVLPYKYAGGGQ